MADAGARDPLDLQALGAAVREARRALGLTQAELAARAGMSRLRVSQIETGRVREVGYRALVRLLRAVRLDLRLSTYHHGRPTLDDLVAMGDE